MDFRDVPRARDNDDNDDIKRDHLKEGGVEGGGGGENEKEKKKNRGDVRDASEGGIGGATVCRLHGWSVAVPEQGSDFSGSGYCAHAAVPVRDD